MALRPSAQRVLDDNPGILVRDFAREIVAVHERGNCEFVPNAANIVLKEIADIICPDSKVIELPVGLTSLFMEAMERMEVFCLDEGIDDRAELTKAQKTGEVTSSRWREQHYAFAA